MSTEKWLLIEGVTKTAFDAHEWYLMRAKYTNRRLLWENQTRKYKDVWRATVVAVAQAIAAELAPVVSRKQKRKPKPAPPQRRASVAASRAGAPRAPSKPASGT